MDAALTTKHLQFKTRKKEHERHAHVWSNSINVVFQSLDEFPVSWGYRERAGTEVVPFKYPKTTSKLSLHAIQLWK
jgi:hypothetical protein